MVGLRHDILLTNQFKGGWLVSEGGRQPSNMAHAVDYGSACSQVHRGLVQNRAHPPQQAFHFPSLASHRQRIVAGSEAVIGQRLFLTNQSKIVGWSQEHFTPDQPNQSLLVGLKRGLIPQGGFTWKDLARLHRVRAAASVSPPLSPHLAAHNLPSPSRHLHHSHPHLQRQQGPTGQG